MHTANAHHSKASDSIFSSVFQQNSRAFILVYVLLCHAICFLGC